MEEQLSRLTAASVVVIAAFGRDYDILTAVPFGLLAAIFASLLLGSNVLGKGKPAPAQ